jgi:hypothetical protein
LRKLLLVAPALTTKGGSVHTPVLSSMTIFIIFSDRATAHHNSNRRVVCVVFWFFFPPSFCSCPFHVLKERLYVLLRSLCSTPRPWIHRLHIHVLSFVLTNWATLEGAQRDWVTMTWTSTGFRSRSCVLRCRISKSYPM